MSLDLFQDTLPSYDEAVRRASATTLPSGISSVGYRFGRPQWPNLAGRRTRNSPNPDLVTVTRHGSLWVKTGVICCNYEFHF